MNASSMGDEVSCVEAEDGIVQYSRKHDDVDALQDGIWEITSLSKCSRACMGCILE